MEDTTLIAGLASLLAVTLLALSVLVTGTGRLPKRPRDEPRD